MSEVETCKNCRFYAIAHYECRRYPPKRIMAGTTLKTAFPKMAAFQYQWCGEWQKCNDATGESDE